MKDDLATRFCDHPWTFLEIQEKGLYNCCPRWVNHNRIGDLTPTLDFYEEWNSKKSRAFRRSILDGSFCMCNKTECPMIQNKQLPTRQDIMDGKHGDKLKFILEYELEVADPPETINLCYDKSCNLRCPSCRKNLIQYTLKSNPEKYKTTLMINKRLLRMIHSKPHSVNLNITGSGDPFGSPSFFELLKKIDPKKNPLITINFQTNGVLWDEARWNQLETIHSLPVSAIISLDGGIKEHYDKVRVGGNWDRLQKNLHFIGSLGLTSIRLDMCVQRNNYKSIPEFIQIAQAHDFGSYTSRIFNWGHMNEKEFNEHNIFDTRHPEHQEFLEILNADYHHHKHDWGNLTDFIID
jgi:MoaA/NifB/PqqE/SkfB family radical SAM enzyme